jgi:hypothetical protein
VTQVFIRSGTLAKSKYMAGVVLLVERARHAVPLLKKLFGVLLE